MKIAIVGTGISGLAAAAALHGRHQLTVFEAGKRLGGHADTCTVGTADGPLAIDTGFIVYNRRNYPGFSALLESLAVDTQPSEMSFSVSCRQTGLEYAGTSLNGLFAQRRNLANPKFLAMLRQILRFNRSASRDLANADWNLSLADYLNQAGYTGWFKTHYLIPMAAAIWSSPPATVTQFPARLFVQFFDNHGLLTVNDQPQWRTVVGGSEKYVEKLAAPFRSSIRTNCAVGRIARRGDGVWVSSAAGEERFDQIVVACHSDQALALLADASTTERAILGALHYESNHATLHTDTSLLPASRRAQAAWNYRIEDGRTGFAQVTYNMNVLQNLRSEKTYCVTLNGEDLVADEHRLQSVVYQHPLYTAHSDAARRRRHEINGLNRTWYCGAYWGYGFHEDGFQSGMDAANQLENGVAVAA